jgi:hypothetical protein
MRALIDDVDSCHRLVASPWNARSGCSLADRPIGQAISAREWQCSIAFSRPTCAPWSTQTPSGPHLSACECRSRSAARLLLTNSIETDPSAAFPCARSGAAGESPEANARTHPNPSSSVSATFGPPSSQIEHKLAGHPRAHMQAAQQAGIRRRQVGIAECTRLMHKWELVLLCALWSQSSLKHLAEIAWPGQCGDRLDYRQNRLRAFHVDATRR